MLGTKPRPLPYSRPTGSFFATSARSSELALANLEVGQIGRLRDQVPIGAGEPGGARLVMLVVAHDDENSVTLR